MSELATADLQRIAREAFGRELSEAKADAVRGRLPTMARAARMLEDSQAGLGETVPATVHRAPEPQERRRAGR
jgi:hypothetical protein